MNKFKVGENVTYNNGFKKEHGVVKSIKDDDYCFVVYNYEGDYRDYTAARTSVKDLQHGWLYTTKTKEI